jgi:hypothetical protein
MAKKSHVIFVEVSAQEIESILKQHLGEEGDDVETDQDVLGVDVESVECGRTPRSTSHDVAIDQL